MTERRSKCKHERLDSSLRCKVCGEKVDIRQKRNKYGNKRVTISGINFDSTKEGRRWVDLCDDPKVFGLMRQKDYPLVVNGILVCTYRADFDYLRAGEDKVWRKVVEDAKPRGKAFKKTDAYRMFTVKKKLMKAIHNIEISEV